MTKGLGMLLLYILIVKFYLSNLEYSFSKLPQIIIYIQSICEGIVYQIDEVGFEFD